MLKHLYGNAMYSKLYENYILNYRHDAIPHFPQTIPGYFVKPTLHNKNDIKKTKQKQEQKQTNL